VATPLSDHDVVRAALVWNLAVEIARGGARACVVAPAGSGSESLWPEPGRGPLGSELVLTFADGPADLARAALDVAAGAGRAEGLVLVRVPPHWLHEVRNGEAALFDWTLLLSSPERSELRAAYALAKRLFEVRPKARVGLTVHGPRSVGEARDSFDRLSLACQRHLGRDLRSYGLLVDDVHVCRAIVNRRPVGLTHPHAAATRALQDVARLLLLDAREPARV
jgi:MinD-like ATPase involved in chromosome partitioning or flagellar assembly